MIFIQIKSMAGVNYVRASDVIAVQFSDPQRCSIMMAGGISISCTEPASVIAERIEAAAGEQDKTAGAADATQKG